MVEMTASSPSPTSFGAAQLHLMLQTTLQHTLIPLPAPVEPVHQTLRVADPRTGLCLGPIALERA